MKLLVDMNLSPDWIPLLRGKGWQALHWSEIGPGTAPDRLILEWAKENGYAVMTQDLDFPQLLFATGESGPSVVLLRMSNEFDASVRAHVLSALTHAETALAGGALLNVSDSRVRLRRLPVVS